MTSMLDTHAAATNSQTLNYRGKGNAIETEDGIIILSNSGGTKIVTPIPTTDDNDDDDCNNTSSTDDSTPNQNNSNSPSSTSSTTTTATSTGVSAFVPKPSVVYTSEDIAIHNGTNGNKSSWVVFDGRVYDITQYLNSGVHPGGNAILEDYLGSDMTDGFNDIGHSPSAHHLLESFFIGYLEGSGKLESDAERNGYEDPPIHFDRDYKIGKVDFRKPLVSQIYQLSKQEYVDLCLQFFCSTAVCDFFGSPYLEVFSRTVWWVIPSLWLPVATLLFFTSKIAANLSLSSALLYWVIGIFIWSFAEYCIHRWVFHFPEEDLPDYHAVRVIHFLGHGVHHLLPCDRFRLVMPPALLIILMTPFYLLASALLQQWLVRAVWPGILTGYVIYDLLHYGEHHYPVDRVPFLSFMKSYHMKHHYKEPLLAFGVSTPLWDYVFGTQL